MKLPLICSMSPEIARAYLDANPIVESAFVSKNLFRRRSWDVMLGNPATQVGVPTAGYRTKREATEAALATNKFIARLYIRPGLVAVSF